MAKHAFLTKRSERVVAAMATSGLLATGLAVPMAQVASATTTSQKVGSTCTVTSDGSSQTALRSAIDSAIADIQCQVVEINSSTSSPLNFEVTNTSVQIRPSENTNDTRRTLTVKSRTGLNVYPADGFESDLFEVDDTPNFPNGQADMVDITIEGLTFRGSLRRALDAGSFGNNGKLTIKNSRFLSNGLNRSDQGGAIEAESNLEIHNSVFYGNKAGAVYMPEGNVKISNSLFLENTGYAPGPDAYDDAYNGGAVYAEGNILSVNSTYLDNYASRGGALYSATGDIQLVLNTFSSNFASLGGGAYSAEANDGTVLMWGNIFDGEPGEEQQIQGGVSEDDLGYNLAESPDTNFTATTSRQVTPEEWNFGTAPTSADVDRSTPVTTAPVLPLTSASAAVKFVTGTFPSEAFSSFFSGKTSKDQLGTNRRSGAIDAGAHQIAPRRSSSAAAPVVVQTEPKRITVPGFAANSTKLTRPMRAEIRKFLRANPDLNNVVCRGFTSSPATAKDRVLARNRGKVACDYIKTLRPEAKVTIRSGSHTNKPGKQIRRVSITLR